MSTERIKKVYKEKFKGSMILVNDYQMGDMTYITLLAAKNKDDFENGIIQNDPINIRIVIDKGLEGYTLEFLSNSILTKPNNEYLAFSSKKVSARGIKKETTFKKVEQRIINTFNNLEKTILELLENEQAHKDHVELYERMVK